MLKNAHLSGRRRLLAAAAALMLLLPGAGYLVAHAESQAALTQDINLLQRESKARAAIAKEASPAVVNITVEQRVAAGQSGGNPLPAPFSDEFMRRFFGNQVPTAPSPQIRRGLGSGIVFDAKGYILTNNHVVAGADKITVKLPDGRQFPAKRVGTDPATDVAVIKIDAHALPVAKLGNSDDLQVGESVLAIGNPFGLSQTITAGIVSAKGRSDVGVADYENFIQTDASINPGNSGGPLLNLKGEVVGVNTAIFGNSGGNVGIGFAIPINQARTVMTALIANGKVVRGFLGVAIQEVTPELADAMGLGPDRGALISTVTPGSPAANAGLKQGDVIVSFANQPIGSVNALRNDVAAVKPGESVPVQVVRDGKRMDLNAKIEEQPKEVLASNGQESSGSDQQQADKVLGMTLQTLNPSLAERMGTEAKHGAVVTDLDPTGPAARAGLQEGAVVLEVNHHPIRTVGDVKEQLQRTANKKFVLLLVEMDKSDRYFAVDRT